MTKVAAQRDPLFKQSTINSDIQLSVKDESPCSCIDAEVFSGKKVPKRVLHFSDGVLEDYSSDEDNDSGNLECERQISNVNSSSLEWGPWLMYQTTSFGSKALSACDYVGEALASFFGITTPKYEYEIEEYKKVVAEEEEKQKQAEVEMAGWTDSVSGNVEVNQAKSSHISRY